MKIKKYVGSSMKECLAQVKAELGEDAVILDSRKVLRGGPFSFLLSERIEVTASEADRRLGSRTGNPPYPPLRKGGDEVASLRKGGDGFRNREPRTENREQRTENRETRNENREQKTENRRLRTENYGSAGGLTGSAGAQDNKEKWLAGLVSRTADEVRDLRQVVSQMADHLKFNHLPSLPEGLERLHQNLLENGVEPTICSTITQELALKLSGEELEDSRSNGLLERKFYERIGQYVKASEVLFHGTPLGEKGNHPRPPLEKGGKKPIVIALVGPTGVGKTTTLAKMATHPEIFGRKRVALVSADTYRIAAVEQLKTFANIAGIPMEAVYRPEDIGGAISRLSGIEKQGNPPLRKGVNDDDKLAQIILIDTAGRSQNHTYQMKELGAFIRHADPDEVFLVLSASTRLEDQLDIISKFRPAGFRRIIFTKLDEAVNYGMILNVCFHERKPVSLLTCGQNVPDDILTVNQEQLVKLVSERSYGESMLQSSHDLSAGRMPEGCLQPMLNGKRQAAKSLLISGTTRK